MSLCSDCFKDGNHEGHDYNFFKSQAGGACDCGDSSVMRESGFCSQHHGPNANRVIAEPPSGENNIILKNSTLLPISGFVLKLML